MAPPPQIVQSIGEISQGQIYLYSLAALLVFGAVRYVFQTLTSPLRSVPGPILARFTRLWEIQAVRKHDNPTFNIVLHEKYGKVTPSNKKRAWLSVQDLLCASHRIAIA